jgi:sulfite exporter TauE/SafE
MNDTVFSAIKQDIERKGIYYGDIVLSLTYHDGRITSYTITTTERRNCGSKNGDTSSHLNRHRLHE